MFGKKKKDKSKDEEVKQEEASLEQPNDQQSQQSIDEEILGLSATDKPEDELSDEEKQKIDNLNNIKQKISKILKSSNIEIVDENAGDEYVAGSKVDSTEKSQQDYDSLKALFGSGDKDKKKELTLTIDDFDYTYTGKYVDEYDLMHLKSIKKVRIQHKMPKPLKIAIIVSSIVAVFAIAIVSVLSIIRVPPVTISSASLSIKSQNYYVDDEFEYEGIEFLLTYSDGSKRNVRLSKDYYSNAIGRCEQENGKIRFAYENSVTLFFSYMGFSDSMTISVTEREPKDIEARYLSSIFNLEAGSYLNEKYLIVIVNYNNANAQELELSNCQVYVDDVSLGNYVEGEGFYVENGTNTFSKIRVEYKAADETILSCEIENN